MANLKERQTSFSGGEFAPDLWGRTDLQKFTSGVRKALNFFTSPFGTLKSRPGTQKIGEIVRGVLAPAADNWNVRYVPFVFSDTDALLLVFTWHKVDFYRYEPSTGVTSKLAVTRTGVPPFWDEDDLPRMRFAQSGDVVTITGGGHLANPGQPGRVLELRRRNANNLEWELEEVNFSPLAFPAAGGTPRLLLPAAWTEPADWPPPPPPDGSVVLTLAGDPYHEDGTHPARPWQWAITRIMMDRRGRVYETAAQLVSDAVVYWVQKWDRSVRYGPVGSGYAGCDVWYAGARMDRWYRPLSVSRGVPPVAGGSAQWQELLPSAVDPIAGVHPLHPTVVYPDRPVTLDWTVFPQLETYPADGDTIVKTYIYRGQDGHFGYIGAVDGYVAGSPDTHRFVDKGDEPDLSRPPPSEAKSLLNYYEGGVASLEDPSAVALFAGRRYFGGLTHNPSIVVGSAVEGYANFNDIPLAKDSDALSFELASGKYEKVRALIPREQLLVLTDNSEWVVGGSGQGGILTPNSIAARQISQHGCAANPHPLTFNNVVLFLQRKGTVPRLIDRLDQDYLQAHDLGAFARHLFTGYGIVDWCYAEDPWSLVWAVRSDGALLSCTLVPDQQLVAWNRHELPGGRVLAVASLPEGYEDAVYLAVQRNGRVYLERMASRVITDVRNAVCLDSSVTYDGRNTDAALTIQVTSIGADRAVGATATLACVGWVPVAGERLRVTGTDGTAFSVTVDEVDVGLVMLDDPLPEAQDGVATASWSRLASVVGDLGHIDGQEVYALLDGNAAGPLTVNGGQVNLPYLAEIAHVGLLFLPAFEGLNAPQEQGRQKVIKAVTVETEGSRTGYVGYDDGLDVHALTLAGVQDSKLEEIRNRIVQDAYGPIPLRAEEFRSLVSGKWAEHGRVQYVQTAPLPVTIFGILRDIEVGGG